MSLSYRDVFVLLEMTVVLCKEDFVEGAVTFRRFLEGSILVFCSCKVYGMSSVANFRMYMQF